MNRVVINLIGMFFFLINPLYANYPNQIKVISNVTTIKKLHEKEVIVLVHGLLRSYLSMQPLKKYLQKQGYQVYYYDYHSTKYSIRENGNYLKNYVSTLIIAHPQSKVHFITHSLGGIVAREALAQLSAQQIKKVGFLIMLAPPNHGSWLAKLTANFPLLSYLIKPLSELSSDKGSYIHKVPVPRVKMGIIAGNLDFKVPLSSARLDDKSSLILVNATHTFILNHKETQKLISVFLEKGTFQPNLK